RAGAGVHRSLSAPRGHLREARRPARGSEAPHRRESRPLRAEDLRGDRRRRHAGAVPFAPAVRQARLPGARRRAGTGARALGSARRLQGLRRSARPVRGAGHDRVPQSEDASRGKRRTRGRHAMSAGAVPIGGPLLTRGSRMLAGMFGLGVIAIAWRLLAGLGSATALNDGYPFGLWIAFDVVTGAALACGGYAVGLLVYILNQGKYHPLMRPAMVTSALGYTLAGVGVGLDVGRW